MVNSPEKNQKLNVYTNNIAPKYIKQKVYRTTRRRDKSTFMVGYFNKVLLRTDRRSGQKKKKNKNVCDLSKNLQTINAGEGVEKREPSCIVGGNVN